MAIEKLLEFAKDGQKNTDDLNLTDGFPVSKKPARQWFNWLFNTLTSKVNEIIDADFIPKADIVNNLTSNDANKPISARQAKILQESKVQLDNSPTSQGPYVSWNKSEGQGETDFINYRGLGSGGFNFYNGDNNNFNLIAYIDGSGVFTPLNGVNGNASTATKLKNARDISFSGAATGSFNFDGSTNASCILTLANSGVVASTYGSTLKIPVLTVNAKGLITGVSEQNIPMVDDLTTDDGTKPLSARQGKKLQDEKFPLTGGTLNGSMRAITLCANGQADYTPSQQGAYLSWNRTSGLGKTDFINHKGGGGGGFDWWNGNQDSYTSLMNLDPNGVLYSLGGFAGNANTATKLKTPRTIFGQTFDGSDHVSGTVTASTGLVQSDEYHYIDMGRNGLDRMSFYNYGAVFNFIDSQNGNVVARITSNGIDCNSATANKLKTARNIALSGAVSGNIDFDGSGNITIHTQLKENTAVARAYVNFSVSGGIVTINKSMNIASVVRNASGVFTLTFANALDDAEYVWSGSAYHPSTTKIPVAVNGSSDLVKSTTQLQVLTTYASSSTGTIDAGQVSVVVF